ncbi:hypothetical protein EDB80DRAFT_883652 [Ilyonectria destructans]|nr:hypothetical protein EDB80DRAFT_883652 [Ilyonectria destructans]
MDGAGLLTDDVKPGVNYLQSLSLPKVTTIYGGITTVTPTDCMTDNGVETPLDVLVCATGFDTTFKPRFKLQGQHKQIDLTSQWADEPRSYLGLAAHVYPNYFMFLGLNCSIGNGPIIFSIEEDNRSFTPKLAAVDDFMQQKDAFMPKITAVWPGSHLHYMEALSTVRWDDFDVAYNGNRFAYLGNGFAQMEPSPDVNKTYYIRDKDDGVPLSCSSMSTFNAKDSLSRLAKPQSAKL